MIVRIENMKPGLMPGDGEPFEAIAVYPEPKGRFAVVEAIPNSLFVAVRIKRVDGELLVCEYRDHCCYDDDVPTLLSFSVDWSGMSHGWCKLKLWAPELADANGGDSVRTLKRFRFADDISRSFRAQPDGRSKEEKLREVLMYCAAWKNYERFAKILYAAYLEETLEMTELIELIRALSRRELKCYVGDDEVANILRYEAYHICAAFAAAILKKGLLDGRWTYEKGGFAQGDRKVYMSELSSSRLRDFERAGVEEDDLHNCFEGLGRFDPEAAACLYALLDDCPEDRLFPAMIFFCSLQDGDISSLEALKGAQLLWPERLTKETFTDEILGRNSSVFCYIFLDRADDKERDRCYAARERIKCAETVSEAVFASMEYEFWLHNGPLLFPYLYWQVLTGQKEDGPFPEEP